MLIENQFDVRAPADRLWSYLLDVEQIAPCMPGAELTEVIDDRNWKGKVNMKFGPVALSFAGTVAMKERDDEAHRVVLVAKGMEQKGKGAANATVTSWLEPASDGVTTVKMQADITMSGFAAQMSRGMLPDVSAKLTQQFADCLQANMETGEAGPATAAAAAVPDGAAEAAPATGTAASGTPPVQQRQPAKAAEPIGGIGLGLSALWGSIKRFFSRLFGGGSKD